MLLLERGGFWFLCVTSSTVFWRVLHFLTFRLFFIFFYFFFQANIVLNTVVTMFSEYCGEAYSCETVEVRGGDSLSSPLVLPCVQRGCRACHGVPALSCVCEELVFYTRPPILYTRPAPRALAVFRLSTRTGVST